MREWHLTPGMKIAACVSLALSVLAYADAAAQDPAAPVAKTKAHKKHAVAPNPYQLSQDERLAVIAAALDSKVAGSEDDCSHLVHAIYEQAGFPYEYASSSDLYEGVDRFQRIAQPQVGDIVVWRGHVGIVVRPSHHVFFSFLSAGPGIEDYSSAYWKGRGQARFFRYLKHG